MLSRTSKQTRDPSVCSSVIITEMVFHKLYNHSKYCVMPLVHINDLKQLVVFRNIPDEHLFSPNEEFLILFQWPIKNGHILERHISVKRLKTWPFAAIEHSQQNNKKERHMSKVIIYNILNSWCTFYDIHHTLAYLYDNSSGVYSTFKELLSYPKHYLQS